MRLVNEKQRTNDATVDVFNDFYNFKARVNGAEYDLVYSYFKTIFSEDLAARNFTVTLFEVSERSQLPILDLLDEFKSKTSLEITQTLCYYLNNIRSLATLLGVQVTVTPNQFVARNILS
jgi:hypothetical protein